MGSLPNENKCEIDIPNWERTAKHLSKHLTEKVSKPIVVGQRIVFLVAQIRPIT